MTELMANETAAANAAPATLARRTALMLPLLALSGCGFFDRLFSDDKKKLPGTREDVLPVTEGLEAPVGLHPTVSLPAPVSTDWPVQGGAASHAAGNAALPDHLRLLWSSDIGSGSAYRHQITATPLVVGDTVFAMDSAGVISAYRAGSGDRLWRTPTKPHKSRTTNIGGGIGYADGTLYAANGFSEVLAIDPATGKILWTHDLQVPVRSAPTPGGGNLFVVTIDETLIGLSAKDGTQLWNYDGTPTDTTLLGQPAPAYADGYVLAGFGSGDLVAVRGDSGAVAWSDSIAASTDEVGVAQISAITGQPIILGEIAIAIGTGGLMVALDLRAGRRLWEHEVSGYLNPVAAGGTIFVTSSNQQVAALLATTGEVAWLSQLPQYVRPKTNGVPILWNGPVLANGKLIYCGTRSDMVMVDATTGAVGPITHLPGPVTVPPIAANGVLYIVTDDGQLRAYGA